MRRLILALIFVYGFTSIWAARVDILAVRSNSMNKNIEVVVISPDVKKADTPVIYLLHGYGGNARSWLGLKRDLPEIADRLGVLFVCPDGKNSWYWDSPLNSSYRYETFVASELVKHIDANYPTKKDRSGRAITGISMGGHGAFWIALRHKETFGAVGSTSGGVDIRPFPNSWEMNSLLGRRNNNMNVWNRHTVINQTNRIKNGDLAIIFDCGYDDFFYKVNQDLHMKLRRQQIDHEFYVRPGGHTGDYWRNSIDYHFLFFTKYFGGRV